MSSRRKFLLQGSLATTSLMAFNPIKTLASAFAPLTGYTTNNNKVIFAHTGDQLNAEVHQLNFDIENLKKYNSNLVFLHAGKTKPEQPSLQNFDAYFNNTALDMFNSNDYNIIYKGNTKIGVITADSSEHNVVYRVNALSEWLKKEKKCTVVACLSQLGYRLKNGIDEITLANNSTNLDIIIGGHSKNFCPQPVVLQNKNKEEVIINHAGNSAMAIRKIEILFDSMGKKKYISFTPAIPITNNTIQG
jgi:hypothetical protein